jgi:hypothetical protein
MGTPEGTPMHTNGKYRIWYVVSPLQGQWQVTFGSDASPFLYATREEAQVIARSAAKLHWENHQDPTGALVELPGETRQVLATYGRIAHVARIPVAATR